MFVHAFEAGTMRTIYFDNSATTMMDPRVLQEMMPFFQEHYGNPSSLHLMGDEAAIAVREARKKVAKALSCKPSEIYFTSSGTESDNIAIQGFSFANKTKGNKIITSAVEHSAILATMERMKHWGFEVIVLPVNDEGKVLPESLASAIDERTILVSVMAANNVVGTIQDIDELAKITHENGAIFHTDAVQGIAKMNLDVKSLGLDSVSISAHKFHGPKGMGAIYIKDGLKVEPLFYGGGQEANIRPATENVPGIVGMGKAIELAMNSMQADIQGMTLIRDQIIDSVLNLDGTFINGPRESRLCNNVHIRFPGISGKDMVFALSDRGIATSTASACTAESVEPSHVLTAMGIAPEEALSVLRVSLSRFNTMEEARLFTEAFEEIMNSKRREK